MPAAIMDASCNNGTQFIAHQKCNNKETPGNDSHILSFTISDFINFSRVPVSNIHHFLYLSSIYPWCQCLQRNLNGRHDSEWVIVMGNLNKSAYFIWLIGNLK